MGQNSIIMGRLNSSVVNNQNFVKKAEKADF
ncbi:hypothetical protein ABIE50_000621 [Chitinophaga sp. OAE865]